MTIRTAALATFMTLVAGIASLVILAVAADLVTFQDIRPARVIVAQR